jgi:hypothetical protein
MTRAREDKRQEMVELPPPFRTTPLAYYVWSRSTRAAHIVAFAIGRFVDPDFRWLSIRGSKESVSDEEGWVRRMLPAARVLAPISEGDLGQGPQVARTTFDSMVRCEGATEERIALDHFLLLPPRLQGILDEDVTEDRPRTVVVANTNRIRQFYPLDPDAIRAYTDVFLRSGFSMVVTSNPPPYPGRYGFDIVLRLEVGASGNWRTAHLVVEKGVRHGDFATGGTFPAANLPWYLEAGAEIETASD